MTSHEQTVAQQVPRPAAAHPAGPLQGSRSRWTVIVAYSAVAAATQALLAPEAEGTAAGLIWLSGNLGGVVLSTIVGLLVTQASLDFVVLAGLLLLALPALLRYRRLEQLGTAGEA